MPVEHDFVQINSGQAVSTPVQLDDYELAGVYIPAQWTAAKLAFEGSYEAPTAGNWFSVRGSDGNAISYTVTAGTFVAIDPALFKGLKHLRLASVDTADGSPENQAADRVLTVARSKKSY